MNVGTRTSLRRRPILSTVNGNNVHHLATIHSPHTFCGRPIRTSRRRPWNNAPCKTCSRAYLKRRTTL